MDAAGVASSIHPPKQVREMAKKRGVLSLCSSSPVHRSFRNYCVILQSSTRTPAPIFEKFRKLILHGQQLKLIETASSLLTSSKEKERADLFISKLVPPNDEAYTLQKDTNIRNASPRQMRIKAFQL